MKFGKIVGFGDSWVYGDELLDPALAARYSDAHSCWTQNTAYREQHCFLGQLGQHYNVPVKNFGIPGGSLQSTIWTYLWWLEHEPNVNDCLILVALTEASRATFYNPDHVHYTNDPPWNKFVHSSWVDSGSNLVDQDWKNMIKQYTTLTSCSDFRRLNYLQAVHFFNGQQATNMNLYQFHTMRPPTVLNLASILMPDHYWQVYFKTHPNRQALTMPGGHPNCQGHKIISDRLILEINRNTM